MFPSDGVWFFLTLYLNFLYLLHWFWEFSLAWRHSLVKYARAFVDTDPCRSCFQILLSTKRCFIVYKSYTSFFAHVMNRSIHKFSPIGLTHSSSFQYSTCIIVWFWCKSKCSSTLITDTFWQTRKSNL